MKTKKCTTCEEEKPLQSFGRNCQAVDGLHYYCKTCAALRQRTWASKHPSNIRKIKQRYLGKLRALNQSVDPYAAA